MSGSNNNHNKSEQLGQIRIDSSAVIQYDRRDPRFGLTIEDSDEYTKNIYPLHFRKRCNDSQEYDHMVKYDWPMISRCWGERYENCAVLKRYSDKCKNESPFVEAGHCACAECAMTLYGPIEDSMGYARVDLGTNAVNDKETLVRSEFKEQNESTIYDRTRIMNTDNLIVDKSPDTKECGVIRSRPRDVPGLTDLANNVEFGENSRIESFGALTGGGGGQGPDPFNAIMESCGASCGVYIKLCPPVIQNVLTPEVSFLCYTIICVLLCCLSALAIAYKLSK